ncbi:hypothetical protein ACERJR_22885 [Klebsiella pneumoniae]|uniref:hypothetical protein n=1 Tax=Klebsiella pneumoniae TaxID=573 RepID=UPI0030C79D1D
MQAYLLSGDTATVRCFRGLHQVSQRIIDDSVASYPGTCACPFNTARNGSSCGGRSAWSKAGGYSPICYKKEVTKEMVKAWRQENQ